MSENQSLVMNGQTLAYTPGQTLLEVAEDHGISIPTLCHLKGTTPTGACRVCVVEVAGARTLVPSCSTPAGAGMVVKTDSPRVIAARRTILELLLASGNHNCAVPADANGDWTAFQLQVQAADDTDALAVRLLGDQALVEKDAVALVDVGVRLLRPALALVQVHLVAAVAVEDEALAGRAALARRLADLHHLELAAVGAAPADAFLGLVGLLDRVQDAPEGGPVVRVGGELLGHEVLRQARGPDGPGDLVVGGHPDGLPKDLLEGEHDRPVEGGTALEEDVPLDVSALDDAVQVVVRHRVGQARDEVLPRLPEARPIIFVLFEAFVVRVWLA